MVKLQQSQAKEGGSSSNEKEYNALLQTRNEREKYIVELEDSHNEQLEVIKSFQKLKEDNNLFSLEIINKSMLAVDFIRKFKDDGQGKAATGANGSNTAGNPSAREIEDVADKITMC